MTVDEAVQLGKWLVQQGYAKQADVEDAVKQFAERPCIQFTHVLLKNGHMTGQLVGQVLQKVYRAPFVDIQRRQPDREVLARISAELALKHRALPLYQSGGNLTVAFADPTDRDALRAISLAAKEPIQAAIAEEGELLAALQKHYGAAATAPAAMQEDVDREAFKFTEDELQGMVQDDLTAVREFVDQGPTVLLVNMMLMRAIAAGASDIHIEPYETTTIVRFRVDGTLYDWRNVDQRAHSHIISRIKVLSGMDTTERFKPQDGRFNAKELVRRDIDLRVSSMPSYFGEKIVMRLLDKAGARRPLPDLGMTTKDLEVFERMIRRPWGMCIITGPTGSGKTTTLYAALERIHTVQKNIMTIEDPVEYQLQRIVQIQINERQGRTFANVLRSSLRQDPDIIMVGEMRDEETAELGVRAALTGHLVLTTLHTNDAAGAIPRLADMSVEPYLVASSVHGVVAQRLVRRVCTNCAKPYDPPHELMLWANLDEEDIKDWTLMRGGGCERCNQTGYYGRVAIFEMMPVTDPIRDLCNANSGSTAIRLQAVADGMKLLRESASETCAAGTTTLDEMVAATAL